MLPCRTEKSIAFTSVCYIVPSNMVLSSHMVVFAGIPCM